MPFHATLTFFILINVSHIRALYANHKMWFNFDVTNAIIILIYRAKLFMYHQSRHLKLISFHALDFIIQTIVGETKHLHGDIVKWKHFPRYWPFVRGIHRSAFSSPHKGQWREALMFSFISPWTNGWVNNRDAGDLRCDRAHYDVTVMLACKHNCLSSTSSIRFQ